METPPFLEGSPHTYDTNPEQSDRYPVAFIACEYCGTFDVTMRFHVAIRLSMLTPMFGTLFTEKKDSRC